ncbi:unnamed protein product [Ilex paraguariensis]|uniref:Uncharacterized protein n=1 Tax=Ilex paraguariensis TaxID=185542 RepID=A0ABC8RMK7_9AQUA
MSQPLHNFSLPKLQWSKSQKANNNTRGRTRLGHGDSSSSSPPTPDASPHSPRPSGHELLHRSPSFNLGPRRPSPLADDSSPKNPTLTDLSETETRCAALLQSGFASDDDKKILASGGVQDGCPMSSSDHKIEKKVISVSDSNDKIGKKRLLGTNEKTKEKMVAEDDVGKGKEAKPKTYIRLRLKNKSDEVGEEVKKAVVDPKDDEVIEKTWNLRPRKPIQNPSNSNVIATGKSGTSKAGGSSKPENKALKGTGGGNDAKAEKKKEKAKEKEKDKDKCPVTNFSIELTPQEIEEDFLLMTGKRPSRKPKKRSKAVQKQNLYPGSYLGSITPDSYKVPEPRQKDVPRADDVQILKCYLKSLQGWFTDARNNFCGSSLGEVELFGTHRTELEYAHSVRKSGWGFTYL